MYRDVFIRVYDVEAITKVDLLRKNGINLTELVLNAIKDYQLNEIRKPVSY